MLHVTQEMMLHCTYAALGVRWVCDKAVLNQATALPPYLFNHYLPLDCGLEGNIPKGCPNLEISEL